MSDFAVEIEGGYATATHHASGHVFEFSIAPEPPYLRGGAVRENQKADRGPDSLYPIPLVSTHEPNRVSRWT
jgi:hypothetical protein